MATGQCLTSGLNKNTRHMPRDRTKFVVVHYKVAALASKRRGAEQQPSLPDIGSSVGSTQGLTDAVEFAMQACTVRLLRLCVGAPVSHEAGNDVRP